MDAIIFMIVAYLTMTSMLMLMNANNKRHYIIVIAFSVMSIFITSPVLFKYEGCFIPVVINSVFTLSGIINYRKIDNEEFVSYTLNKNDYEIAFDAGSIMQYNSLFNKENTLIKWEDHIFITQIPIIGKRNIRIICGSKDRVMSVEYLNKFSKAKILSCIAVLSMYSIPMFVYIGYINGDFRMYGNLIGYLAGVVIFSFILSIMVEKVLVWRAKVLEFCTIVMLLLLIIGVILELISLTL